MRPCRSEAARANAPAGPCGGRFFCEHTRKTGCHLVENPLKTVGAFEAIARLRSFRAGKRLDGITLQQLRVPLLLS
jgi:hypothetical protein